MQILIIKSLIPIGQELCHMIKSLILIGATIFRDATLGESIDEVEKLLKLQRDFEGTVVAQENKLEVSFTVAALLMMMIYHICSSVHFFKYFIISLIHLFMKIYVNVYNYLPIYVSTCGYAPRGL